MLAAAVASGAYVNSLLKIEFARARPDVVAHSVHVDPGELPSGHSAGAALTYLTLGLLLAHAQESRERRNLHLRCQRAHHIDRRLEPHLSRGPLADRRGGGMVLRRGVGAVVLDRRTLARASPLLDGRALS